MKIYKLVTLCVVVFNASPSFGTSSCDVVVRSIGEVREYFRAVIRASEKNELTASLKTQFLSSFENFELDSAESLVKPNSGELRIVRESTGNLSTRALEKVQSSFKDRTVSIEDISSRSEALLPYKRNAKNKESLTEDTLVTIIEPSETIEFSPDIRMDFPTRIFSVDSNKLLNLKFDMNTTVQNNKVILDFHILSLGLKESGTSLKDGEIKRSLTKTLGSVVTSFFQVSESIFEKYQFIDQIRFFGITVNPRLATTFKKRNAKVVPIKVLPSTPRPNDFLPNRWFFELQVQR